MTHYALKLNHVSKRYILHPAKPTLVESLNPFKKPQEFWALQDISTTIEKGDSIGIIGPNGAGKTTLLKIISGITTPTSGSISRRGKLVSLIELTAGFHPEMTGYNNIFLNATILGMTYKQTRDKLAAIIDYADIGEFIHQPFYTYSAGMSLRLGFAVAIHSDPDILVFDETLSMGDEDFRNKTRTTIQNFIAQGKTIIMVTHELFGIIRMMKRTAILKNGILSSFEDTQIAVDHYLSQEN